MIKSIITMILTFGAFVGLLLVWVAIATIPVQLLWNSLCPDIFGLPKIGFWQTFGLLILVNLIFNRSSNPKKDGK
jgi:hypothetical protein